MTRTTRVLLAATALGMAGGTAHAETFTLVTGNGYQPWTDEGLPGGGRAAQIVRQAFAAQGHDVDIQFQPWKRGYKATRSGKFAATFPYVSTPERREEMSYSDQMFSVNTLVVSRADEPISFDGDLQTLTQYKLCEPQGYSRHGKLGEMMDAGELEIAAQPKGMRRCARFVKRGRGDFMLPNNYTWDTIKRNYDPIKAEAFHVADTPVEESPHYLIGAKGNARAKRALDVFNTGLAKLKEQGRLQALQQGQASS